MFTNILMPTDGSEHSERAVERGIALARLCGSKVTGLHVLPDFLHLAEFEDFAYTNYTATNYTAQDRVEQQAQARAAYFLDFVRNTAARAGVSCETVVATHDHPYDAIVDVANKHCCDLIIMTARHRRGLAALVLSNEAERVLHRTSIPVLMFRALMSADHPDRVASTSQGLSRTGSIDAEFGNKTVLDIPEVPYHLLQMHSRRRWLPHDYDL